MLVALAFATTAVSAHPPRPRIGAIPQRVGSLNDAFALGTLIRLDPSRAVAEFRISCGWYYAPRRKLRPGLWKVSLRGRTFGWESNPGDPGSGHVTAVSLTTWERRVRTAGWSGSLRLRGRGGDLSNGPTTDICAGVPG